MKSMFSYATAAICLAGCNSITVTPNTMEPGKIVYATRGGYTMQRSIKNELTKRGYNVVVGRATGESDRSYDDDDYKMSSESYRVPANARYYVKVKERREFIRPIWCAFTGFWWWNFNVSIADQKTGTELMTWRGRGCADSSVRKLRRALDELEKKDDSRQN